MIQKKFQSTPTIRAPSLMKTAPFFLIRHLLLSGVLFGLLGLSVQAQSTNSATTITPGATLPPAAPAKPIGPAPANTEQSHILTTALSSHTRETLREAMESYSPSPSSK
jgi:hypothetical protein